MAVVLVLVAIAVGSVLFHILSPWWWTPIASNWSYIDHTLVITFWITGAVFVAVVLFLAYCVWRFRHDPGRRAAYEPENRRLEGGLAAGTALGVVVMLAPGLFVWHQFITVPPGAAQVEVVGQQWLWSFRLPGADGKLGRAETRDVSPDNALGIDKADASALDDIVIEGGELHLPVGKPVKVLLRSIDVLHNFYVPEFRAKMDMIPGMVTYFWLTPTRTGTFDVLCAELCGVGHSVMRGTVVVDTEADYQVWLSEQPTFTQLQAQAEPEGLPVPAEMAQAPGER
ncbi:cytochrome c oxidase subunit 2 [Rhizobium subbaraonis]|uniref:cytochrome-c oxidase n=1 Tax=Rhizobium subbaraonis TaxID=908946 RepID=A0A285UNT2_9HYPH|nr:cytochrome c oxidase subunit II [Rhizobium subbaraonis]SOC43367.1 cytochrome c oxidase subunit 2 [Rhizobium subbaraonis]